MKKCIDCGIEKEDSEFPIRHDSGKLRNQCIKCFNEKRKKTYWDNWDIRRKNGRECYRKYRNKRLDHNKIHFLDLKIEVLTHYSRFEYPICNLCDESDIRCLTIDHINGGGKKHKNDVGHLNTWLKSNNYPDGFRVLCINCNVKKERVKEARNQARDFLKLYPIDNSVKLCQRCDRQLPGHMFILYGYKSNVCCDCKKEKSTIYLKNQKNKIISHYSPHYKCQNCGVDDIDVLTIDHKNGDGHTHRQKFNNSVYDTRKDIINKEFPDDIQILCQNCQFIKRMENDEHPNKLI